LYFFSIGWFYFLLEGNIAFWRRDFFFRIFLVMIDLRLKNVTGASQDLEGTKLIGA